MTRPRASQGPEHSGRSNHRLARSNSLYRPGLKAWRLAALLLALLACGALAATLLVRSRSAVAGWSERTPPLEPQAIAQADIQQRFAHADQGLGREDYRLLALHLLEGWSQYRTPDGARAHYPGLPSEAGRAVDGMEGFSRMLPLAAVMLARGEDPSIGPGLRLSEALRAGLLAGTGQDQATQWGPVRSYSPQYVEAADLALGVWLARSQLWDPLSDPEKAQITRWLSAALETLPHDGNWMLFPLVVHRSLRALGAEVSRFDARMQTHWERLLHLHRGRGWFHDPPNGFDYYNAWGIHNSFYWLRRIDPSFGGSFVTEIQGEFAGFLRHLVGPQGHPPIGRSTCYRMAVPAPLLGSLLVAPGALPPGQALRALDLTWGWFIGHGALQAGAITAGLCQADPALQSAYSGPASCLWALRSLTIALDLDHLNALLDAPREPLPVEQEAYVLRHASTGWLVRGDSTTGHISLERGGLQTAPSTGQSSRAGTAYASDGANDPRTTPASLALREHGHTARLLEWVMQRPRRPDNRAALYGRSHYATDDDIARRCVRATVPVEHPVASTVDR
jgi:hypothetical protein